jgi:hypothetical protein
MSFAKLSLASSTATHLCIDDLVGAPSEAPALVRTSSAAALFHTPSPGLGRNILAAVRVTNLRGASRSVCVLR